MTMFTGYDLSSEDLFSLATKVFHSKFAPRLRHASVNVDDTFSRFLISILVRNAGSNPYSPSKGGPSNWVYMVARSVCSHAIDRQVRRESVEVLGWKTDAALTARIDWAYQDEPQDSGSADALTYWD